MRLEQCAGTEKTKLKNVIVKFRSSGVDSHEWDRNGELSDNLINEARDLVVFFVPNWSNTKLI